MKVIIFLLFLFLINCGGKKTKEVEVLKMREAYVAGSFYPAEKEFLSQKIASFLKDEKNYKLDVVGLISPHAGYIYSGKVAASGFKQLEGRKIKTVILIGNVHRNPLEGIAIDAVDGYKTPIGDVFCDKAKIKKILKNSKYAKKDSKVHIGDHVLEVQLPFLQKILKDFKIVPILIGGLNWGEYAKDLADAILPVLDENTIIIASTDLSHYPPYNIANQLDKEILEVIENINIDGYLKKVHELDEVCDCRVCSPAAVLCVLYIAQKLGLKGKIIKYQNSGDVAGKNNVVGYGSVVFYKMNQFNKAQREYLLKVAREAVSSFIKEKKIFEPQKPKEDVYQKVCENYGVFVTLKNKGELRGCIGYIQPIMPLYKAVAKVAVEACKDPRFFFNPITVKELPEIEIEISVLSPFKQVKDPLSEVVVGKHGLYIDSGFTSGLLLPQVATEYGWNTVEFLEATCQKAGLHKDAWKEKDIKIYTFTAEIFSESHY